MFGRSVFAALTALLLLVSVADVAHACEPRDHGAAINIDYSDVVFLGTVIRRTEERRVFGASYQCQVFKYDFAVKQAWKGVSGQAINVTGIYSCDPPVQQCEPLDWGEFVVGQTYLVYGSAYRREQGDATVYASIGAVGASKPAAEAAQEMRELSAIVRAGSQMGMPIAGTANPIWLYFVGLGWLFCSSGLMLRRIWTAQGQHRSLTPVT